MLALKIPSSIVLDDNQLFDLCTINDFPIERDCKSGDLIIMTPADGETAASNLGISGQLFMWLISDQGTGKGFDSSTGFKIEGASKTPMSPDTSWITSTKWENISPENRKKFLPIVPDFVVELRSYSDTLQSLKSKMEEWISLGVRLGWLIDPKNHQVYVYQIDQEVICLDNPSSLCADPVVPGFTLTMKYVW